MAILKVGGTQIASSSGSDVTLDNFAMGSSVVFPATVKNTPAFKAYGGNIARSSGVSHEMIAGTEVLDTDGKYDHTTGRFTPTVAGYYYIFFSYRLAVADTAVRVSALIHKDGSLVTSQETEVEKAAAGYHGINISGVIELDDSEYVSPFLWHNKGSDANAFDINFFGFRIIGA